MAMPGLYSRAVLVVLVSMVCLKCPHVTAQYGCLCMIEHPQQKFCQAEFVITGKMVNMEWILIPQLMPTGEPGVETTPVTQSWGPIRESHLGTPGELSGVEGLHHGPINQALNDDPLQGEVNGQHEPPTQIPSAYRHGHPSAREEFMMEPRNYNVIYEIEVDQIYKESDRVQMASGEVVRILAPPPQRSFPMCSYSAMRMKRLYLFAVQNSDMMTACDWVEEYRGLTTRQKQGLKASYGKGCASCQINLSQGGTSQSNPAFNGNTTCIAEMEGMMVTFPDYTSSDCYAMHSHCVQKKDKCKWYSSKDFKKCKRSAKEQLAARETPIGDA